MNKKKLTLIETFTLAFENHKKNNLKEAENLYKKVLEMNPNHFKSILYLGTLLGQTNKLDLAKPFLQKAIQINPNDIKVHNNLGMVFQELGEHQAAINSFEKAISINPNYIQAYFNLGNLQRELGNHQAAINCYKKAIQIDPENINIINALSNLFKLFRIGNVTETDKNNLKNLFLFLFRGNNINHTDISHNAKLLLFDEEYKNQINQLINSNSLLLKNEIIQNLLKEELLLLILQKSLITDKFFEKLITKLRCEILFTNFDSNRNFLSNHFNFIISIAEQSFLNEFIFFQSKKEIDKINQLKIEITNKDEIDELEIAILGCYMPLHTSKKIINKLLNHKSNNIFFNNLISTHIKEPLNELELINSIKSSGKITESVSKKVRKQYEEHPYPRWRYTNKNLSSDFLYVLNNEIRPNKIKKNNNFHNPNVLIAGCGTGKHIISAQTYLNANILGIDLSLSSLAYAKRKTIELGLKNIEFLHTDILQLKNLKKKFDVIECVGTLHHMKDPFKGLEALIDVLEPHGFLKLGLYSKLARQHIIKIKGLIKKKKIKNTTEDIRNFRESIFKEKDEKLHQKIFYNNDFYSISMARDLMFHVQEHCFTIPEISNMLKKLNLEFLGFRNPLIKTKFSKSFPNDEKNISLDNWNKFELNNQDVFANMYQFWVRKAQKI